MRTVPQTQPLIIGHRGAAAHFPENTLASFHAAFKNSFVQMVEFDIQSSAEGVPIVIHDETLNRTTNGKGRTRKKSLSQIKTLDAGYYFQNPKNKFPFRGRKLGIPLFEDLLKSFPKKQLMVEIKDTQPELTREIMRLISKHKAKKHCLIGSLNHKVAVQIEKEFPSMQRFLSLKEALLLYAHFKTNRIPKKNYSGLVASISERYRGLKLDDPLWIGYLKRLGLKIFFWTINDLKKAKRLISLGADGIITDDPVKLGTVLKQRTLKGKKF